MEPPWIAAEVDNQFGSRATYLIDFYHVSEYLAAAAALVCPDNPQLWLHNQQEALKADRLDVLLSELTAFLAAQSEPQPQDNPVLACLRYLENRRDHLDYPAAIEAQLPIGSGLIESGHRHLLQSRLKHLNPHQRRMALPRYHSRPLFPIDPRLETCRFDGRHRPLDYGYTLDTKHDIAGITIWAHYGHLSESSLDGKKVGDAFLAGHVLGWVGSENENGGWPPHLPFQLSLAAPIEADLPGVVTEENRKECLRLYPSPYRARRDLLANRSNT